MLRSDEALRFLVFFMRNHLDPVTKEWRSHERYRDIHLHIPDVVTSYWSNKGVTLDRAFTPASHARWTPFYDAAWELCRRGVLRPGNIASMAQGDQGPTTSDKYSLTEFGFAWLAASEREGWIPFSQQVDLLRPIADRIGASFLPRAAEAIGCYQAGLYMAACAMAGAASEAVLLDLAMAIGPDRDEVLRLYLGSQGRREVLRIVDGRARGYVRGTIKLLAQDLGFWRDGAAHGEEARWGEVQAGHAIQQLIRLAQIIDGNWRDLTAAPA